MNLKLTSNFLQIYSFHYDKILLISHYLDLAHNLYNPLLLSLLSKLMKLKKLMRFYFMVLIIKGINNMQIFILTSTKQSITFIIYTKLNAKRINKHSLRERFFPQLLIRVMSHKRKDLIITKYSIKFLAQRIFYQ